jgi:hypothetical protein
MFLPFETTLNLWFSPNAIYDWEPVPVEPATNPLDAPPPEGADPEAAASCTPMGLPAMRLVFKGIKWTAYPVYGMRENAAWEQASQTRREVDEEQRSDSGREARKVRLPVPQGKVG